MPLNTYQLNTLRNFRSDEFIYGIELITLTTGAGYSALDVYRRQTWVETSSFFSGALLWNPYSNKNSSEGGFYKMSDIIIVASRSYRTSASSKDAKIKYDSIEFRINNVIDCEDTNEIVIHASRLE